MKNSGDYPIEGTGEVDESVFGGQEEEIRSSDEIQVVEIDEKHSSGIKKLLLAQRLTSPCQ
ncbi:MAG: hypothetical protein ACK5MD_03125 [Flavobacteriales bacterium]